jgi:hypothetical protein
MTNLTHNSFCICLFHFSQFSACFEHLRAHYQENQLYQYNIWYVSLCVGDLHTRRSPTQSDTYQMLYWYNWFSWLWARGCSQHVEKWNKHIEKELCVKLVIYKNYTEMAARSTEHRIRYILPKAAIHLPDFTVSQPRRPKSVHWRPWNGEFPVCSQGYSACFFMTSKSHLHKQVQLTHPSK